MYNYQGGPAYNNPYAGTPHGAYYYAPPTYPQYQPQPSLDPNITPPEKLPVKTPRYTHCNTCQKKVWTQVRKTRGGMERNALTDAFFKAVTVAVVQFDTDYEHNCPYCNQKFKIHRLVGHQGPQGRQSTVVVQPAYGPQAQSFVSEVEANKSHLELNANQSSAQRRELEGSMGAAELGRNNFAVELEANECQGASTANLVLPTDARSFDTRSSMDRKSFTGQGSSIDRPLPPSTCTTIRVADASEARAIANQGRTTFRQENP